MAIEGFDIQNLLSEQFRVPHSLQLFTPEFNKIAPKLRFKHEDDYLKLDIAEKRIGLPRERVLLEQIEHLPEQSFSPSYKMHITHFIIEGIVVGLLAIGGGYLGKMYCMIQLIKPTHGEIMCPGQHTTVTPGFIDIIQASSPLAQGFLSVLLFLIQIIVILAIKHVYETYKRKHALVPQAPSTAAYLHISDIKHSKTIKLFHISECIERITFDTMPSITQITPMSSVFFQRRIHFTWARPLKIKTMGLETRFSLPQTIAVPKILQDKLVRNSQSLSTDAGTNMVSIMLVTYCSCCSTSKTGYANIFNPHFPKPSEHAIKFHRPMLDDSANISEVA